MYPCVTVLIGGERGTQFHHVFPIRTCNNFLCHSWNETDREENLESANSLHCSTSVFLNL